MKTIETSPLQASESAPHLVDQIAEEFVERLRRGERPPVAEYEARYPEQAAAIRELFPTLVMMEQLKPASAPVRPASQAACASEVASLGKLGDYRIVREIGRGGMGIVYEAVQESLGRQVALKVLPKQLLQDASRQARFEREARAAAKLHHSNIVPVFGVGEENGLHYYAMQYIHGLGLDDVLRELKRLKRPEEAAQASSPPPAGDEQRQAVTMTVTQALLGGPVDAGNGPPASSRTVVDSQGPPAQNGRSTSDTAKQHLSQTLRLSDSFPLPGTALSGKIPSGRGNFWQSVARIGVQVGEAVHYAHEQGVLHRDIKPSNLLLDTRATVWVTDFGLAKADDQRDLTQTGDVLGTLRYMAPEMFAGQADRRSDVYSLGLTLYELLAQRPAFDEADRGRLIRLVLHESPPRLRTLDPAIPRDLETIVHKAIDREPSHRYATAQELAADLERFLHDEPIQARRVSLATRFTRWCKRNPAVASLTSAIAMLLLVATGISFAAALTFQRMAQNNSDLAGNLKSALADAQKHLTEVKKQEQRAQTNLGLATAEQQRAEGNLDLALQALDAVYLDTIGEQKLLTAGRTQADPNFVPAPITTFTPLERSLLDKGLTFYVQFAETNDDTPAAAVRTAQAHYRVAVLRGALEQREAAEANFREAIRRFQLLIENEPQSRHHHFDLARAYFGLATLQQDWSKAKGLYQQAEKAVSRAIALHNAEVAYFSLRGRIYQELSRYAQWQADMERVVALSPRNVGRLVKAAFSYTDAAGKQANPNRAVALCEQALQIDPNCAAAHSRIGQELHKRDPDRALFHLSEAMRLEKDNAGPMALILCARARIYLERGEYDKALADAAEAVRLAPKHDYLYRRKAQALLALKRFDEARATLDTGMALCPPGTHSYCTYLETRADLFMQTGDYASAEADWTRTIEQEPLRGWHYYKRMDVRILRGNYEGALQDLRTAYELYPDSQFIPGVLANAPESCREGFLEVQNELIASPKADGVIRRHARLRRCRYLLALGREDEARAEFRRLMEQEPVPSGDFDLYIDALLAVVFRDQASYRARCQAMLTEFSHSDNRQALQLTAAACALGAGALDDYAPAIAIARKNVEAAASPPNQRTLAALLFRAGQHEEARALLQKLVADGAVGDSNGSREDAGYLVAITRGSLREEAWFFLTMTQHRLGNHGEARAALAKAKELTKVELADQKTPPTWYIRETLYLLQKEAAELLGAAAPAPDAPPAEKQPPSP